MQRRWIAGLAVALPLLLGCSALVGCSSGQPASGFVEPRLMAAYIPLVEHRTFSSHWGAGLAIAPHVAVTNDHNFNLISPDRLLARSRDYDLLFFRTDAEEGPAMARARVGENVIAYGQGRSGALRQARGTVAVLDEPLPPACAGCKDQHALVFDADAGPGFSGGPVADAESGAMLGIVFGYIDRIGGRRMYAYDSDTVMGEMHRLLDPPPRP
jgi:hypothetical protein